MKALLKKWLLLSLLRLRKRAGNAAIPALTYHSIDESGSLISFPTEFFRAQVSWLAENGYRSLTASQAAAALAGKEELASPGVVLTFDDGFRSVRDTAYPILAEYGFVATIFVTSGYVGKPCGWDRAPQAPGMELMSWEEIRFLARQGWEIGGHTLSHAHLTRLGAAELKREITAGRRILQEEVGCEVSSFAYPFGEFDQRCAQLAREAGFCSAWTMEPTINRPGRELWALGRFNCDRIRSDSPQTAALAAQVYLGDCYHYYAFITARWLRVRAG